jgi:hypothetical protein
MASGRPTNKGVAFVSSMGNGHGDDAEIVALKRQLRDFSFLLEKVASRPTAEALESVKVKDLTERLKKQREEMEAWKKKYSDLQANCDLSVQIIDDAGQDVRRWGQALLDARGLLAPGGSA